MPHKHYHAKKRIYLEPPSNGSTTVRTRVTRVLPPPVVTVPEPPLPPPVCKLPPPPPPPVVLLPPPPPKEPNVIDVIAVDVEPGVKSSRSSKSSKSRSHSRHSRERDREVIIERDRLIPVPVPVRVQPEYETFRYVEAPRRWSPPALPEPPRRESVERERQRIVIEDHRRTREYYHR